MFDDNGSTAFSGNQLATRLLLFVLAASTILSILASGIQLYFSYQRDLADTEASFNVFENSFTSSLTSALWEFNFKQVEVILDGLGTYKDVIQIELVAATGQVFQRGPAEAEEPILDKVITLTRYGANGEQVYLGDLRIGVTLANIHDRIWSQFRTLLVTNLAKTTIVSAVILILFHFLISRHLRSIAAFVQHFNPSQRAKRLRLRRKRTVKPDDLDLVVEAINTAQERVQTSYKTVANLNLRLDASNVELLRSNEELQHFAYIAAHDLQEPLRKITAFGGLLLEDYRDALNEEGRQYIDFIVDAASRQKDLIRDLLAYCQVDSQADDIARLDLNTVLQEALQDLSLLVEETGAEVTCEHLPSLTASRMQMKQVFINLIGNALKYRAPERKPTVRLRCESVTENQGRGFRIIVEDNGIGFPEDKKDEIFEPFKRLHSPAQYGGTGIGLAIVRKIIFSQGGDIVAKGRPEQGSTFIIYLPATTLHRRSVA